MARTLKSTGLATAATMIVAFDDDGTTLREWVNSWSSTTADGGTTWTNNNGTDENTGNMWVHDGATTGTGTWKGSGETYLETKANGSFDFFGVQFPTPLGDELAPATVSFFGALLGSTAGQGTYWLSENAGNSYGLGPDDSGNPVPGSIALDIAAQSQNPGATAVPTDGTTKFSVGLNANSDTTVEAFYGLESGSLASDGSLVPPELAWKGVGAIGGEHGQSYTAPHKFILWAAFNRVLTLAEMQSLHDDPFGTLFQAATDTTAPTLSSPSVTATGTTTADLSVSTDEGNGTLHAILSTTNALPSVVQIQAGQDSTGSAAAYWNNGQSVSATGTQNASATGLSASTTYYAFFQHQDAAGNDSTVTATGVSATTNAIPSVTLTLKAKSNDSAVASAGISYAIRNAGTALSAAADVSGTDTTDASGVVTITDASLSGPVDVTVEVTSGTYSGQTLHAQAVALD